jgi:hypothetical protein
MVDRLGMGTDEGGKRRGNADIVYLCQEVFGRRGLSKLRGTRVVHNVRCNRRMYMSAPQRFCGTITRPYQDNEA